LQTVGYVTMLCVLMTSVSRCSCADDAPVTTAGKSANEFNPLPLSAPAVEAQPIPVPIIPVAAAAPTAAPEVLPAKVADEKQPKHLFFDVQRRQADAYACSRRLSQLSCIMGCQRCTEVYGRRVYRMADCCVRCQVTQAAMVDDGPENCSLDFFNMSAAHM
jgi:hypothetical protein